MDYETAVIYFGAIVILLLYNSIYYYKLLSSFLQFIFSMYNNKWLQFLEKKRELAGA